MFCTQGSIQGRANWSQVVTFSVHNCVPLAHRSYIDGPPISSMYIVRWRVPLIILHNKEQEKEKKKSLEMCRMKVTNWTTVRVVIKDDCKPTDSGGVQTTRVGTLIVATIYLQLIQNRYMFRSFTVLQCSHQHCVQPVASRCGSRRIPLAAPVVLIVRMERSTAWRISGTVLKRMPRSGSFILGIKSQSQGLMPLWLRLDS